MARKKRETRSPTKKRPFRTPRLTVYGNLIEIASAKGGTRNDGGSPKPNTRTSGGQA